MVNGIISKHNEHTWLHERLTGWKTVNFSLCMCILLVSPRDSTAPKTLIPLPFKCCSVALQRIQSSLSSSGETNISANSPRYYVFSFSAVEDISLQHSKQDKHIRGQKLPLWRRRKRRRKRSIISLSVGESRQLQMGVHTGVSTKHSLLLTWWITPRV